MGIEEWMDRKVAPIAKSFVPEDYPGYFHEIARCNSCPKMFELVRVSPPEEMKCPYCREKGLTIVTRIRKIYLQ